MSKKSISIMLAFIMIVFMFCLNAVSAGAAETVAVGDEVKYVFTIAPLNGLGGVSVRSSYDPSKLRLVSYEYLNSEGVGVVNDVNEGTLNWNDVFNDGIDTNNTDLFVATYEVIANCDVDTLGLASDCTVLFNVNLENFGDDFNSIVVARAEVTHNSTDTDTVTDSETETDIKTATTDTDVRSTASLVSNIESDTKSDTDISSDTTDTSTNKVTYTSDVKSSDNTSKKEFASDSSKSSAPDSSKSSAPHNASSKTAVDPTNTSIAAKTNTAANTDTVKTASTIAIVSLVIVLVAASAVVFFVKRNSTEE